ncbi:MULTISPECIES: type II toxin-antitoxin system HicB family antitoxin [Georhizobium]|nr:type II toxin-antitoxin system HicB family antitoxin [Georhizobium profundi]
MAKIAATVDFAVEGCIGREIGMLRIEVEQEDDGRWLAEVIDLPGVMAYGESQAEAEGKVEALALRVLADRLEHGEVIPELGRLFIVAA